MRHIGLSGPARLASLGLMLLLRIVARIGGRREPASGGPRWAVARRELPALRRTSCQLRPLLCHRHRRQRRRLWTWRPALPPGQHRFLESAHRLGLRRRRRVQDRGRRA